jgi:hypothetical protein
MFSHILSTVFLQSCTLSHLSPVNVDHLSILLFSLTTHSCHCLTIFPSLELNCTLFSHPLLVNLHFTAICRHLLISKLIFWWPPWMIHYSRAAICRVLLSVVSSSSPCHPFSPVWCDSIQFTRFLALKSSSMSELCTFFLFRNPSVYRDGALGTPCSRLLSC